MDARTIRDSEGDLTEPAWRWLAAALGMPALLATPPLDFSGMAPMAPRLPPALREKLVALLGAERVRLDDVARASRAGGGGVAGRLRLRAGDLSRVPDAVLCPRTGADVAQILALCSDAGIAVTTAAAPAGRASVALDLSALDRIRALDAISGLAEIEAGIAGTDLARHLALRGLAIGDAEFAASSASLGARIAAAPASWLHDLEVATPRGLVPSGLRHILPGSHGGFGVVTAATVRVHGAPERRERRGYLFADFAGGLAAIRELVRDAIPHDAVRLSDAGETRFHRGLAQVPQGLWLRLGDIYREIRRFDDNAAALSVTFSGNEATIESARKRFDALARRLGALVLGVRGDDAGDHHAALMDRGVTVDALTVNATWSRLPLLYAVTRAALDQAMRSHAPRRGANGLVLARVADPRHDGARLHLTWLYPRILEGDVAQAEAIRGAALHALASQGTPASPVALDVVAAIRQALDPAGILNPGTLG